MQNIDNNSWRGKYISLRGFSMDDIDRHFKFGRHYDSESERLRGHLRLPLPPEKVREVVSARLEKQGQSDDFWWIIEDHRENIVGNIRSFDCCPQPGTFSYGIFIEKKYWNRGYASEALILVCRFYFEELRYQKLTTIVNSFNERSILFHQRFGFVEEGRLRRMQFSKGLYYDHIYFGLLGEEFTALYPSK